MKKIINYAFTALLLGAGAASAAVPDFINFQGRLLDSNKLPRNGSFAMTFKICDSLAGACVPVCAVGNPCLWTEDQNIPVTNGVFAAKLGAVTPIGSDVFSAATRYLDITVAGETLSPREQLVASPFSFKAAVADGLANNDGSALLRVSSVALAGFYSDNSVRSRLGLVIGANVQAYDADLTTYGGITPSANIQSLLVSADYAAARTNLGLAIGTNVQAYDADLVTYGGITPSANVQSLLGAADYAAMRTALTLVPGTNVQAWDTDLDTLAGNDGSSLLKVSSVAVSAFYSTPDIRTNLGLAIGVNVQAYDADLDDLADGSLTGSKVGGNISGNAANVTGIVALANGGTSAATYTGAQIMLGLVPGTSVQAYDADLDDLADGSLTGSKVGGNISGNAANVTGIVALANGGTSAATYTGAQIMLGLVPGTSVQAYDADLTTYGGITPSANIQSLLGSADYAAARTNLGLAIGTNVQAYDLDLDDLADGSLTPSKITNTAAVLGADNTFTGSQILRAGTAAAGTAPLKFTAGTDLTAPEVGALEFDGTSLKFSTSAAAGNIRVALNRGQLIGVQTITNPTAVYTPTPGTGRIIVELWGGGGGGGSCNATASGAGGGGGSGGYARYHMTGVQAVNYVVAVGIGGVGNVGAAGSNGGVTTFAGAVTVQANGGAGGGYQAGSNATFKMTPGGAGGVISTNGTVNGAGAPGGNGFTTTTNTTVASGFGGSTSLGGGGVAVVKSASATSTAGNAAIANTGSGGSGAACGTGTAATGGGGAAGRIVVYEFY